MTQTGSPDPRIDLVCITSLCPRQFLQNFKRRRRCLASPPRRSGFTQPPYSTLDAAEGAPSTASLAAAALSKWDVRFTPVSCRDCRRPARPLWAILRLMQRSKKRLIRSRCRCAVTNRRRWLADRPFTPKRVVTADQRRLRPRPVAALLMPHSGHAHVSKYPGRRFLGSRH